MRKINEIILHCTDTPTNTSVQAIRKYHVNVNKWRDIGYHFLVDINGKWYKGRNIIEIGAHCVGHNTNSIGIAYIGRNPTEKVIESLAHVCNFLITQYDIKKVTRHCTYNKYKSCPNFKAKDIETFNKICVLPLN